MQQVLNELSDCCQKRRDRLRTCIQQGSVEIIPSEAF